MELVDFLMASGRLDATRGERVLALRRARGESESVIITRLGMIDRVKPASCRLLALSGRTSRFYRGLLKGGKQPYGNSFGMSQ
jgi:hypothetical protein